MFTTRPELLGTFGVVATTHWLASSAGMAMLEKGGNAFDAAVAAGFVLHIAEPHLNGPGGDMPALIYDRASDAYRMICGQGVAPGGATSTTSMPAASWAAGVSVTRPGPSSSWSSCSSWSASLAAW